MKRRISALLAVLSFCLLLTACGHDMKNVCGEVVDILQDTASGCPILIIQEGKRQKAVLLTESTYVFADSDDLASSWKAAPTTDVSVDAYRLYGKTSVTTGGKKITAYQADTIRITGYLVQDAATLSDGTPLDAWKTSMFGTTYQLKDGTELLWEDAPSGPENHYVANLENFDDLSEAAKPTVRQYYEEQGALYDLQAELDKAWAEYQEAPETFSTHYVSQDTSPAGSSQRLMYFNTNVTLPVSGDICQDCSLCAAFDRETGESIPLTDLFTCPEAKIAQNLLDLAEKDGSIPNEPEAKREMLAAFRMEYLSFWSDYVMLAFPAGTLPSQEYTCLVSVDYAAGLSDILQPWAIPQSPPRIR